MTNGSFPPPAVTAPDSRRGSRVIPAGLITVGFVALLYVIEVLDVASGLRFDDDGIRPREVDGLPGVLLAPLLHHGWDHLYGNTAPLLVLGFVVLVSGIARGLAVTAVIWVLGGLGTWLIAGDNTVHVGASGVIFGWIVYLIVRGFFNRSGLQILLGMLVLFVYGGVLWGVLPTSPDVSWQGHLCGAIAGVVAARLFATGRPPRAVRT